eukprot:g16011.t1
MVHPIKTLAGMLLMGIAGWWTARAASPLRSEAGDLHRSEAGDLHHWVQAHTSGRVDIRVSCREVRECNISSHREDTTAHQQSTQHFAFSGFALVSKYEWRR